MIRKFIYCDASLVSEGGHFAMICRNVTRQLRAMGIDTTILANAKIEPALAAELQAHAFFAVHTWAMFTDDPMCGWLVNFERRWQACLADLSRLEGVTGDDLVYYESAVPAQIMALVRWAERFGEEQKCPRIIMRVNEHSGVLPGKTADGRRDWVLGDPQAMLYRYAGLALPKPLASRVRFVAPHRVTAEIYSFLLGHPVAVLPEPYDAPAPRDSRAADSELAIGFLGAQRENKGFHLVPDIAGRLLAAHESIRIVVQNSWNHMQKEMAALQEIEGRDARLELIAGDMSATEWSALLDEMNLVVIPYNQASYASSNSGVSMEALMNAIPQAVPRHTVISEMLAEHGMPGVEFERSEPGPVTEAVGALIEEYPHYAERALQASALWRQRNGPEIYARALLGAFGGAQ